MTAARREGGFIPKLEEYWTTTRAASALIAVLAIAQFGSFVAPESGSFIGRLFILTTSPLLLLLAWITFRRPTWPRRWALAFATMAEVLAHLLDSRSHDGLTVLFQLLFLLTLILLSTLAVICGLFRASPLKLFMGTGMTLLALLAAILLLKRPPLPASMAEGYAWSEPIYLPDPTIEHVMRPNATQRIYYPDDPRSYFESAVNSDRLDARLFMVFLHGSSRGGLAPIAQADSELRLTNISAPTREAYQVTVAQGGLHLTTPGTWTLTFSGRADATRPLQIGIAQSRPSYRELSPCQSIMMENAWRNHSIAFEVMEPGSDVRIEFRAGEREVPLSIRNVNLMGPPSAGPIYPSTHFVTYRTNSAGFRDRERTIDKRPGVYRIACLGDSFTFGQGVKVADRFTDILERRLNERLREPRQAEALNFGVCGYATWQQRKLYDAVAHRYQPDVVLVSMVNNDNMSPKDEESITASLSGPDSGGIVSFQRFNRSLQGWNRRHDFSACVEELKALDVAVRSRGGRLAVVFFRLDWWNWDAPSVAKGLKSTNIPFRDLYPDLRRDHSFRDITVSTHDGHPNELANKIAAEAIERFLDDNKLMPVQNSSN